MQSGDPLQINNKEPLLGNTTVIRGETQILELRPTVPVLCPTTEQSCSLVLYLTIPDTIKNCSKPFAWETCEVHIEGHTDGADMNNYMSKHYNLTVYGKVTYQIGNIDTETFLIFLKSDKKTKNISPVWTDFSILTAVSIFTHVSFELYIFLILKLYINLCNLILYRSFIAKIMHIFMGAKTPAILHVLKYLKILSLKNNDS